MAKLKTKKALLKRIKITGRKKILRRITRQSHFNAKESGKKTRKKRKLSKFSSINRKRVKKILSYL